MEKFVVSARKYRPATFDTVVGQSSITNTLKNAIKTNHLAQAFLFCGSRGVGKTTCARILAKTINCSNRTKDVEACNECDSCTSFNEGASLNVHELDAASNNSVDDIRQLIDQVRFAPQIGSHKVYIIDEVHMLSSSAFNAFLKTLEEPPAHAIFILATTEKHKIIPTILSRCQIFDFNRISVDDITQHLLSIAEKEAVDAEEEALHLVAEKADGALRDALSIFDQLVSFSGKKLSYQDVLENLNILDYDYYFKATGLLSEGNIYNNLLLLDQILQKGFDGRTFINGLANHFRNLLVGKDTITIQLLEVGKSIKERYLEQSKTTDLAFLMEALKICNQCDLNYPQSKNKRLLIETSLMQIASISAEKELPKQKKKQSLKAPDSKDEPKNHEKHSAKEDESIASKPPLEKESKESHSEPIDSPKRASEPSNELPYKKETESNNNNSSAIEEKNRESDLKKSDSQRKINSKTASLSIEELTKPKESSQEENQEEAYTSASRQKFTEEEFNLAWKELIEKIENENEEGSSIVVAAMRKHQLQFLDNFQLKLSVDNKSQLEEIRLKRTDFHDFLRKRLKNGGIELEFEIERNPTKKKAYTDEEKFQEMATKNPHLNQLRKDLGFDFV